MNAPIPPDSTLDAAPDSTLLGAWLDQQLPAAERRRVDAWLQQHPDDAARVRSLGAPNVAVTGSIKFDVVVPPAMVANGMRLREAFGRQRPVLLCASTREGEEELILDAFRDAAAVLPADTLLLLNAPEWMQAGTGGRHVEFGYALALGKRIVVVGDAPGNVFHRLPQVALVTSVDEVFP
jgi:3-deoxy-D-manno-octulosonic-acid transferase